MVFPAFVFIKIVPKNIQYLTRLEKKKDDGFNHFCQKYF